MRKAVEEYLEERGYRVVRQPAEPAPCTFETLVDGFLVHVLRLDSESYRRAFWREAYRNGHTIGHVPRTFESFFRRNARTFEEKVSLLLGVAALFGVYTVATLLYRRLSLLVRRLRRPTYYERERERRQKLAIARREVRRHRTLNPQPTFDAIRAALRVARTSPEAAIRLGSLLSSACSSAGRPTSSRSTPRSCATRRWRSASARPAARASPSRPRRSCPRRGRRGPPAMSHRPGLRLRIPP